MLANKRVHEIFVHAFVVSLLTILQVIKRKKTKQNEIFSTFATPRTMEIVCIRTRLVLI